MYVLSLDGLRFAVGRRGGGGVSTLSGSRCSSVL